MFLSTWKALRTWLYILLPLSIRLLSSLLALIFWPFRFIFRLVFKLLKWPFIITLPITIIPIINGISCGIIYAFWNSAHVEKTTEKWIHEVRYQLEDWGVGGGVQSFHQFMDAPGAFGNSFGVMRINSYDWTNKLGFILPNEYEINPFQLDDTPIDKQADLQTLMRNTNDYSAMMKKKEAWIYLSGYGWPIWSPWDKAFQYAVRFAEGHRKLNKTSLYYAECEKNAGFLCGVWNTRTPALIHFIVDDKPVHPKNIEDGLTYAAGLRALRPVTARIIQFPLEGVYTGLPSDAFPGYEEQMLAIMTGDRIYEQFDPYHPMAQMMQHFSEYTDKLDKTSTSLRSMWKVLKWLETKVYTPLGIKEGMESLDNLLFILTGNAFGLFVLAPYKFFAELVGIFFGAPKQGDRILGDLLDDIAEEEEQDWSFEGMFGKFAQDLADAASSKKVMENTAPTASSE